MTVREFWKTSAVLLAAAMAWTALPAVAANITYHGSDTEGDVSVVYAITTDGTLGLLTLSNIVSSSATFTGHAPAGLYNFGPLTGINNLYFSNTNPGGVSPVTATSSSLLFNFAGGGGLNLSLGNYDAIYTGSNNPNDLGSSATPGLEGLLFALAGAQSTDDDSVVFHVNEANPIVPGALPDREIDNVGYMGNFYLQAGTYTTVAATPQAFATVNAAAVPEPASWSLLALGVAGMGLSARRRRRGIVKVA